MRSINLPFFALALSLLPITLFAQTRGHIKIGHVGHDHHLALFFALDAAQHFTKETPFKIKTIKDKKLYLLSESGKPDTVLEIVRVGGGSKMPTALAQNVIDVGFGGVAAVLAAVDKGAPIKMISPLHYKGDMFVVGMKSKVQNWEDFVAMVKKRKKPVRIGYKNPVAVAKLVFEQALKHEGLSFSKDVSKTDVKVHMVNLKGGGKLNVSLSQGLVEGYVGNNPFPAIAEEKRLGKIVCDLETLPPGAFRDHPCCCVAANSASLEKNSAIIRRLLFLVQNGTKEINKDLPEAVKVASRWIGTSARVENISIASSGYSMQPDSSWHNNMAQWVEAMMNLGIFSGKLSGLSEKEISHKAYDFSLLNNNWGAIVKKRRR